ncbi:MAG: helix-turn-helix domain-containing protein [bacterium]|nr:helix-turn-helix domain-containing protein [bacterium]
MRTVGEVLKNKRLEKKLTLAEVEAATKIRAKYLEAVEKNDFTKIVGGAPTTKGFIKNYAEFLGLSPVELLAIFRRDFHESKTGQIIPHGYLEPLNKGRFSWSPKLTLLFGIVILVLIFSGYLIYQVSSYNAEPNLTILNPKEGSIIDKPEIEINGKSDTDAVVYVNGETVALDKNGDFQSKISLFRGENKVKVEAVARNGKRTEIVRRVEYEGL